VRILVPLKQVPDPDSANKLRVSNDNLRLDNTAIEKKTNPFDECALETALRLTEDARSPRQRHGEVVVVTLGPSDADVTLRSALATGADRAIRIEASDDQIDARCVAQALAALTLREACNLVLIGKQSVDGDSNEVGQRLAARLGWPQVTFASRIVAQHDSRFEIERAVDGGTQTVAVQTPVVITVDLRIVGPDAVRSTHTPTEYQYIAGLRFASLPAIMQARRKPLVVMTLDNLGIQLTRCLRYVRYEIPPSRIGGRVLSNPGELMNLLINEAKVL